MRNLLLICTPLLFLCSCFQEQVEMSGSLQLKSLETFTDTTSTMEVEEVLQLTENFEELGHKLPSFGDTPYSHWIKLEITNTSSNNPNYSFITRGIDSLYFYQFEDTDTIQQTLAGAHITNENRQVKDSYITIPVSIPFDEKVTILMRPSNWDYKLSLAPFKVLNSTDLETFFTKSQLVKSIYMGGMVILFLFGTTLFILFKSRLYLYYSICVILSLGMMLTNFEYAYTLLGFIPHIIANKNIYGVFTSLLPLNYLLFAGEFLQVPQGVKKIYNKIALLLTVLTFSLLFIFLFFDLSIFRHRKIFEGLVFALCTTPLILLYHSFKANYKPAWIFLFATMPVLITGIFESLGEWHNTPVQQMHNIYYASTFFELFVLTIGLSFKFKTLQEEKRRHELDIVDKEISAKDKERREIGQAMHDNVGGLLLAAKLKFDSLRDKFDTPRDIEALEKGLEILDESAHNIREISHILRPSTFLQLGLVEGLNAIYSRNHNPTIKVFEHGYDQRLEIDLEDQLFSIIQEGVTNAIKHACASEIIISLSVFQNEIKLLIEDDGVGFEPKADKVGMGLQNLHYRIEERLKGSLVIDSTKGNGTTLMISIPK